MQMGTSKTLKQHKKYRDLKRGLLNIPIRIKGGKGVDILKNKHRTQTLCTTMAKHSNCEDSGSRTEECRHRKPTQVRAQNTPYLEKMN